ncbi:carbohydrate ABC transporter permease [Blautia wexlerae]|nr:carbohydrate ABC transporter permease [Blautia wexlerae]NSF77026.1 carbohydrate ABC transporter permease [Blautia wexlerae]
MSAMKIKKTLIYLFLAVFTFIQIFPFYWLVTFSFKSNTEIFDSNNLVGLPKVWHLENFSKALMGGEILRYLLNSVFYAAVTVVVSTLLASMVAYAINRMYWKAKGIVAAIFSLGIMIPVQATLLPLFQGLDRLGIRGGYLGLMLPYITFAMPMTVMILGGFFKALPREIEEAACIDGCNIFNMFFRIIFPMIRPGIATSCIFAFLNTWNELLFANTFVDDAKYKTLPVGIMSFVGEHSTNWGIIGAGMVIATLPTVLIYLLLSKQVQESFTVGAVKG